MVKVRAGPTTWEHYEGWMYPKIGKLPYKVIDDPKIIAKKNSMREALREEYTRRHYNPYRNAAGVGGQPVDTAYVRYNAMMRTQAQFFRAGPRYWTFGFFGILLPYGLFVYNEERWRKNRMYMCRTGQIAYADRKGKTIV